MPSKVPIRALCVAMSLTIAGAGGAMAAPSDFFFSFDEESFDNSKRVKRLYERLKGDADEHCAQLEAADERADCRGSILNRVVTGLDEDRLTNHHEEVTGEPLAPLADARHFLFYFEERSLDSISGTTRLYKRLQSEGGAFCASSETDEERASCLESLSERVVAGIDDSGLDRCHERESRKGAVYITDQ